MRRMSLCLAIPFVLACTLTEPEVERLEIRVQGTVTAADDGTPVVGARLAVWEFCFGDSCTPSPAADTTDTSGDYSLSFVSDRCRGGGTPGNIIVGHPDFETENIGGFSDSHMTCTEALQTVDIQLERSPPPAGN